MIHRCGVRSSGTSRRRRRRRAIIVIMVGGGGGVDVIERFIKNAS